MRKLIFVLLAFFALCTYIRAFSDAEAQEIQQKISVEIVE